VWGLFITNWIAPITFFKRGPADPSQQCKIASNSIQDPPPYWILTIFKLKFGGGNQFSPAMTNTIEGNNSVGSLLEPLGATVEEGDPCSGLKNVMLPDNTKQVPSLRT
jgi:hypothetical protein